MDKQILKDVQPTLSQEQSAYVTVSPQTGTQQCANCQFFLATNYVHDYELGAMVPLGSACALVNGYPEPILATGWCKEWRQRAPYESEPLEVEIVEGGESDAAEAAAETPTEEIVTEEKAFKTFIAPKDIPVVQRLVRSVKSELQPGTTLIRKAGKRYTFIISSNGFEDRHEEHVVTRALKEYVQMSEAGTVEQNDHMFWHTIPVGKIIAAGEVDGFLVEIAEEAKTKYGKAFYDYFEAHPDGWGASLGFWVRRKDIRIEDGKRTYTRIDKDETSTLPREAAANLLTLSAIGDNMKKTFSTLADEIFGKGTYESLKKGTGAVKKRAESEGLELKQKDAETVADAADAVAEAETAPPASAGERDALLLRMIDGLKALIAEVEGVATATEAVTEAADENAEEIKSLRKEVTDSLNEMRQKMSLAPRIASQDKGTELAGDEAIEARKKLAPVKVRRFGGLELDPE